MKPIATLILFLAVCLITIAQPKISSFSPVSGPAGTALTISGSGFNLVPANNTVFFGSVKGVVTAATATSITVTVPAGATYQPLTVTSGGLSGYSPNAFALTPGTNVVLANTSFAPKQNISTGAGPISVVACDLDNDGKPDIAVVNDTTNTLSILRNLSTASSLTFQQKIDYPTSNRPRFILSGDIDGDGKPDLIIANAISSSMSVFRNTNTQPGIISLAAKVDFATDATPTAFVVADLDNDGKPDIVSCNRANGTLSVLRNTSTPGNVSFAGKADIELDYFSYAIAAADFNGDGKTDLAVSNSDYTKTIALLKNTSSVGNIVFNPFFYISARSSSYSLAVADIDSDGKLDIISAGTTLSNIWNKTVAGGEFSFSEPTSGNDFYSTTVVTGIFDNDHTPEVFTSLNNATEKRISAIHYDDYVSGVSILGPSYFETERQTYSIAICDLNADGKPDIVTANEQAGCISVLKNEAKDFGLQKFSPATLGSGAKVYISGFNLSNVTGVSFGGVPAASFEPLPPYSIDAVVGNGVSGNIKVTTATDSLSLPGFTYIPTPVITSFAPQTAGSYDTIVIKGQYFEGVSEVLFGGTPAVSFSVKNSDSIIAVVGSGSTGNIEVKTIGGSVSQNGFTFVPAPIIESFAPSDALPGEEIIINGSDFTNVSQVTIGGINARSFQVMSGSKIIAVVDSLTGGSIYVETPFGSSLLGGFYNGLAVHSLSSYKSLIGSQITISGHRFSNEPGGNIVRFGGVRAAIINSTQSSITVEVPKGAAFSTVSVTCQNFTAYSDLPFLPLFAGGDTLVTANSFLPKTVIINPTQTGQTLGIALGDLDGDGKNDLVTGGYSGTVLIYKNGGSIASTIYHSELESQDNVSQLIVNDVNSDGKPDIIAATGNGILIFENKSSFSVISFLQPVRMTYSLSGLGRIMLTDIDGDGRPDITAHNDGVIIFQNLSKPGHILFLKAMMPFNLYSNFVAFGDIDGDKKPDMVLENNSRCAVVKNTSVPGSIRFDLPLLIENIPVPRSVFVADIDGDGLQDVLVATIMDQTILVARNITSAGVIGFDIPKKFAAVDNIYDRTMHDLDGDGRPDFLGISANTHKLCVLINRSVPGEVNFAGKIEIETNFNPFSVEAGDLDNDGKPDIIVATPSNREISVYRNRVGEADTIALCPPSGNTTIAANKAGITYQWQADTGQGFANIANNNNYSGVSSASLILSNIPSLWNGYKYRCLVDGTVGSVAQLGFRDIWTAAVNSEWENTANWSCGVLPDSNTDVFIYSGTVNINVNTTVRSLKAGPGVVINVKTGVELKILK